MARKKSATFAWVRERDERPPPDPRLPPWRQPQAPEPPSNRLDRRAHRAAMIHQRQLLLDVVALPVAVRRALPLNDLVAEELDKLADLPPSPAHRRQLNRVKGLLQDEDLVVLEAAVAGDSPVPQAERVADRWLARLLAEGDEALAALLDSLGDDAAADRQRLRQLVREVRSAGEAGNASARRRLVRLLRRVVREAPAAEAEAGPGDDAPDPVHGVGDDGAAD